MDEIRPPFLAYPFVRIVHRDLRLERLFDHHDEINMFREFAFASKPLPDFFRVRPQPDARVSCSPLPRMRGSFPKQSKSKVRELHHLNFGILVSQIYDHDILIEERGRLGEKVM